MTNAPAVLIAALRARAPGETLQVHVGRLALLYPDVKAARFQEACVAAKLKKKQGSMNVMVARRAAQLYREIEPAPASEQTPEAFAAYMKELVGAGASRQDATLRAVLRYPSIRGPAGGLAASKHGFVRGTVRTLVGHIHNVLPLVRQA